MFGDQFRQASYPGNDQPPEIRSCHTAVLGVIRSLKIVKREQGTYWKICHSCFWKYELHFLPFNSSWKEFKVLQSLQEIETYEVPAGLLGGSLNEDAVFPSFSFVYFKFSPPFRRTIQNLLLGPLARHRSELSYRKISKVLQVLINIVCKLLLVSVYVPICPSHSLSIHPSFYPTCLLTDLSLQASKRIFFFHMLMEHF